MLYIMQSQLVVFFRVLRADKYSLVFQLYNGTCMQLQLVGFCCEKNGADRSLPLINVVCAAPAALVYVMVIHFIYLLFILVVAVTKCSVKDRFMNR